MTHMEQHGAAMDELRRLRAEYTAGRATYDEMRAAAIAILELRRAAERARFGVEKTRITPATIASLLR